MIELLAEDKPVEVEVDKDVIELLADDKPVEVEVESDVIELLAEDRPVEVEVDSDEMALVAVPTCWATEYSWLPLIASVLVEVT